MHDFVIPRKLKCNTSEVKDNLQFQTNVKIRVVTGLLPNFIAEAVIESDNETVVVLDRSKARY